MLAMCFSCDDGDDILRTCCEPLCPASDILNRLPSCSTSRLARQREGEKKGVERTLGGESAFCIKKTHRTGRCNLPFILLKRGGILGGYYCPKAHAFG